MPPPCRAQQHNTAGGETRGGGVGGVGKRRAGGDESRREEGRWLPMWSPQRTAEPQRVAPRVSEARGARDGGGIAEVREWPMRRRGGELPGWEAGKGGGIGMYV